MATPADLRAKQRLEILLKELTKAEEVSIAGSAIDAMAQVDRKRGDSLHRLVCVDLHPWLCCQVSLAEKQIDGAAAQSRPRRRYAGTRIHGRPQSYRSAEVQPPWPRHDGNPDGKPADTLERHRHDGCACDCHPCRGENRESHLQRCAFEKIAVFSRAI